MPRGREGRQGRDRMPPSGGGGRGGRRGGRRGGMAPWLAEDPMARVRREQEVQANMAQRQMAGDMSRIGGIYGALQGELAPMAGQYDQQAQGIASDLQSQLGSFTNLLGTGTPSPEATAAQAAFGGVGAGALGGLAADRGRNLAYQASAQRQAVMEPAVIGRQYGQELRDFQAGLRDQIPTRLDELADQSLEQQLALREFAMRRKQMKMDQESSDAMREFLLSQVGSAIAQQGRRGGGRRGGQRGGGRRNP